MNKILIFIGGVATGSFITWRIIDQYYRKRSDEEIESVVERFKQMEDELNNDKNDYKVQIIDNPDIENKEDNISEYKNITKNYNTDEAKEDTVITNNINDVEDIDDLTGPYVISPDEFGENGYDIETLKYYQDDVMIDGDGQIVPDPEVLIGNALNHIGEYEDDCVHVRNDDYKKDYEVLVSDKTFKEVYHNEED